VSRDPRKDRRAKRRRRERQARREQQDRAMRARYDRILTFVHPDTYREMLWSLGGNPPKGTVVLYSTPANIPAELLLPDRPAGLCDPRVYAGAWIDEK
jgi:hypothetical protein